MQEHEYEPVPGLPEQLPEGEYIVWQGRPRVSALSTRVFHTRTLLLYFVALIAVHIIYRLMAGSVMADILLDTGWQLGLAAIALALLDTAARLYARSTLITFTNRRLVLRSGVAVPMIVNIPWDTLQSAGLHVCSDGTGDILLTPKTDRKLYYMMLWPYVRPWRFGRVQPLLRGIEDPQQVTRRLAEVIADERSTDNASPRVDTTPHSPAPSSSHEQPLPAL